MTTARNILAGFASVLAVLVLCLPASAQQPTQAQANAIRQSCRADYQANCAGVPTGGRAALSCLQEHAPTLSGPCQSALAAVGGPAAPPPGTQPAPQPRPSARTSSQTVRQACGPDFRRFCRGVPLGGGRAIMCLEENAPSLSMQCRGALAEMRERR